jgi:hypothetical protein
MGDRSLLRSSRGITAPSPCAGWASRGAALLVIVVAFTLLISSGAGAATPERFLKETFGGAAQPSFANAQGLAIDDSDGDVLVMDQAAGSISRFKPNGEPAAFESLGTNVISEAGGHSLAFGFETEAQIAVDNSGTATDGNIYVTDWSDPAAHVIDIFDRAGKYLGDLSEAGGTPFNKACGVTVDPTGAVYVGDFSGGIAKYIPTSQNPTDADFDSSFAPAAAETCQLAAGSGPSAGSVFAVNYNSGEASKLDSSTGATNYVFVPRTTPVGVISVIPSSGRLLAVNSSSGVAGVVREYDASGATKAEVTSEFDAGSRIQGIAGSPENVYISQLGEPSLKVFGTPVPFPELEPVDAIGLTEATLHGLVNPAGLQLSSCKFEYGLSNKTGFEGEADCTPSASQIPPDFENHQVEARIDGLVANATYRVRLSISNTTRTLSSEIGTLETAGKPAISEVRARDATGTSAVLEAKVNPSGFDTSYEVEWGPTSAYGNHIQTGISLGAGTAPVVVTAQLSALSAGTRYHYRILAFNAQGIEVSPDREVETLNSCGLPDARCLELVSPREPGPVAQPGLASNEELDFQSALEPGSLMYSVANGLPGTTKAAEVLYHAVRGPDGWTSTQFSPPILSRNETKGNPSGTTRTQGLSDNLECAFLSTNQLLTGNASMRLVVEEGGSNLYRRDPGGGYTSITSLSPESIPAEAGSIEDYHVDGFSKNCEKVVFSTKYFRYPGIESVQNSRSEYLYEWDEGSLRSVGIVPAGEGGTIEVGALPGGENSRAATLELGNIVSANGRRVFFSAERRTAANEEEIGKVGIFVREDGTVTRDLSQSQTSKPDTGALFQYAAEDGSRVFFIANAGLTTSSSVEGEDLYEYNLETNELTDLSATEAQGGAQVAGVLGLSSNGAHTYFAARGQLVVGEGPSLVENKAAHTFSIYSEESGDLSYVGVLTEGDLNVKKAVRVSPDGRYLLFQSQANVTGYVSGGAKEAYLFDSRSAVEPTVCVSCRQDDQPSVTPVNNWPLGNGDEQDRFHGRARLVVRNGVPTVFFTSFDRLAPAAIAGVVNLYEWAHGQVFVISTEPVGLSGPLDVNGGLEENLVFSGASSDGTDLYFTTPGKLTWEDPDERRSMYDARAGGGVPEPTKASKPCDAVVEGACQGQAPAPGAQPGDVQSSKFAGPGNKTNCRKGFVRRKGKCTKKHPKSQKRAKKRHKGKNKSKAKRAKTRKGPDAAKHRSLTAARHPNADRGANK